MSILIACDGSALRSTAGEVGKGPIAWAWAREDEHWYANGHYVGTNQKAELIALMTVLLMHPKEDLIIQSDSKYALNTTEKWMWGWAKKGWIKSDLKPIANLEVIQNIHSLMSSRNRKTEFVWVKGHDMSMANPLNHRADELATETSARIREAANNSILDLKFYSDSKGREFNTVENAHVSPLFEDFKG